MRILFDSKKLLYKDPFGVLVPNQPCRLNIHVPAQISPTRVVCVVLREDQSVYDEIELPLREHKGAYAIFGGDLVLPERGLYFYFFRITAASGTFRLFKQGDDTNMEAGDLWQVSCVPADFVTPDWAQGATMYQVFPDRFARSGQCDLTGKLEPFTLHKSWGEDVDWRPNERGEILNNDFFGGNFRGITEKMDYIASLGATILYLNPISKSFSSHRYDTGDYKTPDPMLGTEEDFAEMCRAAHERGIRVVLDGVYSHTGADSLYFNKFGSFDEVGAYQSTKSPYHDWYTFYHYPDSYHSWWDFDTLPTVRKMTPSFIEYVITGEDSVIAHWLKLGADGFRLDVVDELPDEFVLLLKRRLRELKPDGLLIGEVWEDASNKIAYDRRRRYFVDGELDSAMNYPFRTAILNFLRDRDDGRGLRETVMTIVENYPAQVVACNMNLLGTHDTPRILTALIDDFVGSREEMSRRRLSRAQYPHAQERLMMASFLQFTLPGTPSIYYGDEAGMEGYKDPFNRRTFPWGYEDPELLAHYRRLGAMRKEHEALRLGNVEFREARNQHLCFTRTWNGKTVKIYVNRSDDTWQIPAGDLILGHNLRTVAPNWLELGEMGFCAVEDYE